MIVMTLALLLAFSGGVCIGRLLPRRGRHARRLTGRGRDRLAELRKSQASHPAGGNVIIDLRAWVPSDDALVARLAQTPASAIKIATPAHD